ncbi:LysR family transcriptional regulator substrate-binding protein [Actinomadura sp. ATCC 31491]|uniref:LysR family transcriptional regulator substrate-binding protein n=1 Tax=Actinomadura luzonensis TaxID=2805427 RepID=A0ABT0FMS0_9ACTN|nr:LysR family transcriptional regulator substrate-binding protein [Actinomadura luzonensis]
MRQAVMEGSDGEVLEWLETGAADVAVLAAGPPLAGLTARTLAADRMLAVLPSGHPLGVRVSVPVEELARHPFIMSSGGCEPLITALAEAAGASLKCHYRVRETGTILAMVAEGLGVSVVPELSLPAQVTGVHAVPLDPAAARTVLLTLPPDPLPTAIAFAHLATPGDDVPGRPPHRDARLSGRPASQGRPSP